MAKLIYSAITSLDGYVPKTVKADSTGRSPTTRCSRS